MYIRIGVLGYYRVRTYIITQSLLIRIVIYIIIVYTASTYDGKFLDTFNKGAQFGILCIT